MRMLSRASSLVYGGLSLAACLPKRSGLPQMLRKPFLERKQRIQVIEVQRMNALDGVSVQRLDRAENGRLNSMSALNDRGQLIYDMDVVAHACPRSIMLRSAAATGMKLSSLCALSMGMSARYAPDCTGARRAFTLCWDQLNAGAAYSWPR
jgi:hypothetical protein